MKGVKPFTESKKPFKGRQPCILNKIDLPDKYRL